MSRDARTKTLWASIRDMMTVLEREEPTEAARLRVRVDAADADPVVVHTAVLAAYQSWYLTKWGRSE